MPGGLVHVESEGGGLSEQREPPRAQDGIVFRRVLERAQRESAPGVMCCEPQHRPGGALEPVAGSAAKRIAIEAFHLVDEPGRAVECRGVVAPDYLGSLLGVADSL